MPLCCRPGCHPETQPGHSSSGRLVALVPATMLWSTGLYIGCGVAGVRSSLCISWQTSGARRAWLVERWWLHLFMRQLLHPASIWLYGVRVLGLCPSRHCQADSQRACRVWKRGGAGVSTPGEL